MTAFPAAVPLYALVLPLAAPAYVVAYAFADLFQAAGPVRTAACAISPAGGSATLVPGDPFARRRGRHLHVDALSLRLSARPRRLPPAIGGGAGCGAHARPRAVARLLRVALPLARPAIAGGVALALMETLADFGAVSHLGADLHDRHSSRLVCDGRPRRGGQLAAVLLGWSCCCWRWNGSAAGAGRCTTPARGTAARSALAGGGRTGDASVRPAAAAGFLLPAAAPVRLMILHGPGQLNERFLAAATSSFGLAAMALLTVALAMLIAYAKRAAPGRLTAAGARRLRLRAARLGRRGRHPPADDGARPGDQRGDGRSVRHPHGLLITSSAAGLLFAYAVRFSARRCRRSTAASGASRPRSPPPR